MDKHWTIGVDSEIGVLEAVIINPPGPEIENMTPGNAERSLYSDILNLSASTREYAQLQGVLEKAAQTFCVRDLLHDILMDAPTRQPLVARICGNEKTPGLQDCLLALDAAELTRQLVEGVVLVKDNLSKFLSTERYALRPLHNFFYTRDSAMAINDRVLVGKMANPVREREAIIMEAILTGHPSFRAETINPMDGAESAASITIEGGDVLVAREDVLIIGIGARTTPQAVDYILEGCRQARRRQHIVVQELPRSPESFIHLDMVFTLLDRHECMVYEPVIMKPNRLQTVHIELEDGEVRSIREHDHILDVLRRLGMDLEPICCGGNSDPWLQEREQWHSGANFFALGPGQVIGYGRNVHTIAELDKRSYAVLDAARVISGEVDLKAYDRFVVTIEGAELARGGGGCRCMTLPLRRRPLA